MTLFVPYDGSDLAKTAVLRATHFDTLLEDGVVVATIVPERNKDFARERGWLGAEEPYDEETVVENVRAEVADLAPEATFVHRFVHRYASTGVVAKELRRLTRSQDATIVFVGSADVGRITQSLTTGSVVARDSNYDTFIVSNAAPTRIEKLEEAGPDVDDVVG